MWTKTKFTELLGIAYPIVQGPFGGRLSSIELASTVSNLGGMGSFGAQPLSPEEILQTNNALRKATDKPYAINLWVNDRDDRLKTFGQAEYEKLKELFAPYFNEFNVPFPQMPVNFGASFNEQVQAVLEAKPPVFSFIFGIPSGDLLEEFRRKNIKTIGTATTVDEAIALEQAGVDAIVATGFEAGGHRASFLRSAEDSLTGVFALVPQVADHVSVPVIAAGGIADGRGIRAALTLGAHAVQIGTAFLATQQSAATPEHKQKLFSPEAKYTTLTKIFSGRLARGIRSRLTDEIRSKDHLLAPYPMQSHFLSALRSVMQNTHHDEYITFWSGQSAPLLKHKDATQLFHVLLSQADAIG